MSTKDWSFEANLERGCLPTGEPLEALYGAGWWTQETESGWPLVVQCHRCGGNAYDLGSYLDCENCGEVYFSEELSFKEDVI